MLDPIVASEIAARGRQAALEAFHDTPQYSLEAWHERQARLDDIQTPRIKVAFSWQPVDGDHAWHLTSWHAWRKVWLYRQAAAAEYRRLAYARWHHRLAQEAVAAWRTSRKGKAVVHGRKVARRKRMTDLAAMGRASQTVAHERQALRARIAQASQPWPSEAKASSGAR